MSEKKNTLTDVYEKNFKIAFKKLNDFLVRYLCNLYGYYSLELIKFNFYLHKIPKKLYSF